MPAPVPELTATFNGFVNGEDPSSLSGMLHLATTATVSSPTGTYAITLTQTPDDALNNHSLGNAALIALDSTGHGGISGLTLLGGLTERGPQASTLRWIGGTP